MAVITAIAPQTKVLETIKITAKTTKAELEKVIGRPLGSPINGIEEGAPFTVTLTGEIQFREFANRKTAYFLTKEGFSVSVNGGFDPLIHKANEQFNCICRVFESPTDGSKRKYAAFVL